MTDLSTLPQEVNVDHYAGDTLTIHVGVSAADIGTRLFYAQIRGKKSATKIDATFDVVLTPTGCDLVLPSAASKLLTKRGVYNGYWDVQLAMDGGLDPVTTLGYGEMRLHSDVTRVTP